MIVVVDDDDDDDDERKLYKIENYQDSNFQNFSSRIVFFLNIFDFSKNIFQNLVRRGVRGGEGWCRNMKAERKNSKLKIKVFFKVLKFLSLFSSISMIFFEFLSSKCHGERGRVRWPAEGVCRISNLKSKKMKKF